MIENKPPDLDPEEVELLKREARLLLEKDITALIYQDTFVSTLALMVEIDFFYLEKDNNFTKVRISTNKSYEVRILLLINTYTFSKLDPSLRINFLKKEMYHLALQHLLRVKKFSNKLIAHTAANLVIWDMLFEGSKSEVDSTFGKVSSRFISASSLGISSEVTKNKPSLEEYYKIIESLIKDDPDKITSAFGVSGEEQSELEEEGLNDWGVEDSESEDMLALEGLISDAITTMVNKASNTNPGNVPGQILSFLKKKEAANKVKSWKQISAEYSGKNNYKKKTSDERRHISLKSKSKRGLKYSRLYKNSSGIIKEKVPSLIAVAIDVSGSVSDEEIQEIYSHLDYIQSAYNTKILITQFDAKVKSEFKEYSNKNKIEVLGRGGTVFQPVVDLFYKTKEKNKRYKIKSLFIFTDGEAEPAKVRHTKDVVYVLTNKNNVDNYVGQSLRDTGCLVLSFYEQ